ncbi:deoxyribose-phosphate aldolase [Candidatus Solirubrobacter pratensis]|uniref:deoxyribose-phosphate aldolase n=1 Tax=Candidatus Solirubrobacter pratensis TaxID=1298857 RepID=UPI00041DD739|nr:deoxyribose-phosphate aldolase [Candidatus Solirubrobacter pratensis]
MDLTSLNDDDTPERIDALCAQAVTPAGEVAAVCIYAPFVRQAVKALEGTGVRVATVANFPAGAPDPDAAAREADAAVNDGADEVDVVLPYERYAAGDREAALEVVRAARDATAGAVLKVILETGRLGSPETIEAAAADALAQGADFVKTSTGKLQPGATPEAARAMLTAIAAAGRGGFKASGGVRTAEDAASYLALADEVLGEGWTSPATFRFGASGLLSDLLAALGVNAQAPGTGGY